MAHRVPEDVLLEHAGFVRAVARGILADAHGVEDVVQETMLAALRRPPRRGGVRAWLGTVARRLALRRRRSDLRRDRRERTAARPDGQPPAADVAAQLEAQELVARAVRELGEPYRSTVVLRFFHGRSVREIAAETGAPRKTVEARLTRALHMLRGRLDRGFPDRRAWMLALLPLALPQAVGAAPGPGGAVVKGGVVMSAKKKLAVVVALFLAGAGLWGLRAVTRATPAERGGAPPRPVATRAEHQPSPEREPPPAADPASSAEASRWAEGVLEGTVTTPDGGAPPAGTRVRIQGQTAGTRRGEVAGLTSVSGQEHLVREGDAGSGGRFRLEGIPAGHYRMFVFAPGHAPWSSGHSFVVDEDHAARSRDCTLRRGAVLTLAARDLAGRAVAGLPVTLSGGLEGAEVEVTAVTDPEGVAVWRHLAAAGYTLALELEGALRSWWLLAGEDEEIAVTVVRGAAIVGTVHGPDGAPVRGAAVTFAGPVRTTGTTGDDGRYRVPGLGPGRYRVSAVARGFAAVGGEVVLDGTALVEHTVACGAGAVTGRVTGLPEDGPGTVRLYGGGVHLAPRADAEGRFAFFNLPAGSYRVCASAGRSGFAQPEVAVEVGPGGRVDGIVLVLTPERYGEVELEIREADGTLAERVQLFAGTAAVRASYAPAPHAPGRFRLRLPAGEDRRISIRSLAGSGGANLRMDVEEGRTTFRVVDLPAANAIRDDE